MQLVFLYIVFVYHCPLTEVSCNFSANTIAKGSNHVKIIVVTLYNFSSDAAIRESQTTGFPSNPLLQKYELPFIRGQPFFSEGFSYPLIEYSFRSSSSVNVSPMLSNLSFASSYSFSINVRLTLSAP